MAAADIVVHKGEKEEKYQLYVEDYVMSYLKNYEAQNGEKIFFYGKREQRNRKYYLYGAGQQREISYFAQYELLEEIVCRPEPDMPVFFVQKGEELYELAGYYIFYQSNEAMQNYMVEQRRSAEAGDRMRSRETVQAGNKTSGSRNIIRPQNIVRPQNIIRPQNANRPRSRAEVQQESTEGSRERSGERMTGKRTNGLMAVQLSAIFVILIAIVINSTNSYTKLEELNQAAVEVFFAMENEEAVEAGVQSEGAVGVNLPEEDLLGADSPAEDLTDADLPEEGNAGADIPTEGTVLRLADLDAKFEEENQAAIQEDGEDVAAVESGKENAGGQSEAENGNGQEADSGESGVGQGEELASAEEMAPSEQAFARNFAEYYKIEKGDTLYKISIKIYGDTGKVKEICELNGIKDPDNIKYGQKILLP